jgi:uncharacterized protein YndB with AHSA1/START domain
MTTSLEPIHAHTTVGLDPERAFELFTDRIDSWWPVEHHSRAVDQFENVKTERIEFQPFVGGQVLEHMSNGQTLPWGEVLVWEPPARFVLAWKPNAGERPPTEVEVRFVATPEGTSVELEHRGWERLRDVADAARPGYAAGWERTLARFAEAAEQEAA